MGELSVVPKNQAGGMTGVAESRQAQEVQSAMVIAQRFPRDTTRSLTRVLEDCKRRGLAEKAVYRYVRGGSEVTGASIRLAEAIARSWGNIDFGVIELERKPSVGNIVGESVIQAYSWDLETNTRTTKIFTVKHWRDTKKGGYALTDERDIYELTANQGARRLRACILQTIPADIIEEAMEQCQKTMQGGQTPLIDRIRSMVAYFKDTFQVSQDMIEKRLGHKVDAITESQLVQLKQIANSLKDGMADREDFFEVSEKQESAQQDQVVEAQKPKTIKNFAPQTTEEAKKVNAEIAAKKEAEQKAEQVDEKRQDLLKAITEERKRVKWTPDQLAKSIESEFNKAPATLSNEELEVVIQGLKGIKTPE